MAEEADTHRKNRGVLFVEAMTSCTAVTYVNGSLVGDPLDVKMFESTGWILDEPNSAAHPAVNAM